MAQGPFKIDQLQLEPGATGDRRIRRKPGSADLEFLDGVAGALTLKALAGFNLGKLLTVGSGAGAQYSTIQSAIDAIPAGSDPYTVLVGPGVYSETVTVSRTNVTILGMGRPTITQGSGNTLVVQASGLTTPLSFLVKDITIRNSDAAASATCVRFVGGSASTVGSGLLWVDNCSLIRDAAGGHPLWANSVCNVSVDNCGFVGNSSSVLIDNCGWVSLSNCKGSAVLQMNYDSAGDLPALPGGRYWVDQFTSSNCALSPAVLSTLEGGGSLVMQSAYVEGQVHVEGDMTFHLTNCDIDGNVSIGGTAVLEMLNSNRGALSGGPGTTCSESVVRGVASFVAVDHVDVVLDVARVNDDYIVLLEPNNHGTYISAKTAAGFTITAGGVITADVPWVIIGT